MVLSDKTKVVKFKTNIYEIFTIPAAIPQQAATARMLKTADPTIVPTPISPSVIKVPMTLTNSSGADVAAAINVAPPMSFDIFSAEKNILLYIFKMLQNGDLFQFIIHGYF